MKTIPKFPAYCITKSGKVWSLKTKRFLKPILRNGYFDVGLWRGPKAYPKRIHRLVLETFIGPCPEGMEGCHNNGIKANNKLKNLRWDTHKNNQRDSIKHGTHATLHQNGEANPGTKLKEKDVRMIIYMYRTGLFLQKEIAKFYDIKRRTVGSIINRINWKCVWEII